MTASPGRAVLSLLNLRELSRHADAKTRPATDVISSDYVSLLSTWRHHAEKPDWTIHDFCQALARLGGHQNRKHAPPPPAGSPSGKAGPPSKPCSTARTL